MDYGALPPEINSGRMYSGPGSGPMMAAAAAWDRLAAELRSAADSYSTAIAGLMAEWQGPSSSAMAAAAAAYATWMNATAAQAEATATQARDAVTAYETALAGTVPPALIAANRAHLTSLLATNIFGQNASAIAATEVQYVDMWAQDATAMYDYAGQSATAAQVMPFTSPPQTTNPGGRASQSAGVAQATGPSAGAQSTLSQVMSRVPSSLQSLATPAAAAAPATSSAQGLSGIIAPGTPLTTLLETYELGGPALLPVRNVLVTATSGMALAARGFQDGTLSVAAAASPLGAGLGSAGLAGAASAGVGEAGLVGALSVPPSWAAATPTVRLAAAALQGMGVAGAPVVAAASQGTVFGQMALASIAGSALGNAVPRATGETGSRAGGPNSRDTQESPSNDKDSKTSDKLNRVLAELSQKPESVQHWHTDKANLESLLEALSKKPGVHAVHLSSRDKPNTVPPKPRWG